jgi:hypothetical protein
VVAHLLQDLFSYIIMQPSFCFNLLLFDFTLLLELFFNISMSSLIFASSFLILKLVFTWTLISIFDSPLEWFKNIQKLILRYKVSFFTWSLISNFGPQLEWIKIIQKLRIKQKLINQSKIHKLNNNLFL